MKYPVLLMESVHKIFQDLSSVMKEKNKKKLARIMQKLGFNDLVPLFYEMPPDREAKVNMPFRINRPTYTCKSWFNVVFILFLYATVRRERVIDMP